MESRELRAVLQGLPHPALVLSSSSVILAANDGICRLTNTTSCDSFCGKKFDELGFDLARRRGAFQHQDWQSFFHTCSVVNEPSLPSSRDDQQATNENLGESKTEGFWDYEEQGASAVVEVAFARTKQSSDLSANTHETDRLRASMTVHASRLEDNLIYVVTFSRPHPSRSASATPSEHGDDTNSRRNSEAGSELNIKNISEHDEGEIEMLVHQRVSTAIPYFTALFDARGHALHLSKSWFRVTDMDKSQSLGDGWREAIHPDDKPYMERAWTDMVSKQEVEMAREARFRSKTGEYHWFLMRIESSKDESGRINYWFASMMDVHNLLLTRQESEHRRKSVMALISNTDVCLWGLSKNRTQLLNEGSLSWSPDVTLGKEARQNVEKNTAGGFVPSPEFANAVAQILDGKSSGRTLEHQVDDKWYRSTLIADLEGHLPNEVSDRAVRAVLGLTIDISDVRARTELETQNEMLIEKERAAKEASELKSRFVANMSHELRTPVAGIIGMNDLLWESLSNEKQRDFSENIRSSAAQLLAVINDVLDLSKIEAGRLELEAIPFHICELVQNVHNIMANQAESKGLTFTCEKQYLPQPFAVIGDPNRLQQIFLNLVSNSIKFTRSGRVTIGVSLLPSSKASKDLAIPAALQNHSSDATSNSTEDEVVEVEFFVEDTGCGMSKGTIEKSFEAFSQADSSTARQFGGTGLGLTITRQLVEMMKGSIHFTSTVSVGTRAVIKIAFAKPHAEVDIVDMGVPDVSTGKSDAFDNTSLTPSAIARESALQQMKRTRSWTLKDSMEPCPPSGRVSEQQKKMVMVVEDNVINLKIAHLMVEALDLQTISAYNGKEALEILEQRTKSNMTLPDIILMDCMMPIMDGYEATKQLRQDSNRFAAELRKIPIIALTASAHKGDKEKCLDAGMDDYLIKPVNKKKLDHALSTWIFSRQQQGDTSSRQGFISGDKS